MLARALAGLALALSANAESCVALSVNISAPVSTTAPYFASWNIDASRDRLFFDITWDNATLVYLLSQIGGAHIRFGGTGNDALYYGLGGAPACGKTVDKVYECLNATTWDALVALSAAAASPIVLGLNIHPAGTTSPPKGPWNGTNARALLAGDGALRGLQ